MACVARRLGSLSWCGCLCTRAQAVCRGAVATLVLLLFVACGGSPALAANQYPLVARFEGVQAGGGSIAVAPSAGDDWFVGDKAAGGVERVVRVFSGAGVPLAVWDGMETPSGSFGSQLEPLVAVDDSLHRLYVADLAHHAIDVFSIASNVSEGENKFVCQITGVAKAGEVPSAPDECAPVAKSVPLGSGGLSKEAITALGVDPVTHRLLVGYGQEPGVVYRFSEGGEYEETVVTGAPTAPPEFQEFGTVRSVAVDGAGVSARLLVSGATVKAYAERPFVCVFEAQTNAFVECWTGVGAPGGVLGRGPVAVDEGSGLVFLGDAQKGVSVYEVDGRFVAQIAGVPGELPLSESKRNLFGELGEPQYVFGLAVDGVSGQLYTGVGFPGVVDVFGDAPVVVPTVVSGAASPVHAYGARLRGSVDPEGVPVTSCRFEYVADGQGFRENYFGGAASVPCAESLAEINNASAPVAVHADIEGLEPQTKYHARLVAANGNETPNTVSYGSYGTDVPFTTLPVPVIVSQESRNVTPSAAELLVSVNPEGSDTECVIEYGLTDAYGTNVPCEPADLGSGSTPVRGKVELAGLTGGATYHWRVVLRSVAAKISGADQTFVYLTGPEVTQDCGNEGSRSEDWSLALPDCRGYEQVTPVFKNGAVIERGLFIAATEAASDGSRVMGMSIQGFEGTEASTGSRNTEGDPYMFTRGSGGWVTTPLAPPASVVAANTNYVFNPNTGTALFGGPASTTGNTPVGGDNFYVRGESGALTEVGPASPAATGATGPVSGVLGASRDERSFMYTLADPSQEWPFDQTRKGAPTLYEYAGPAAEPALVGVSGEAGSTSLVSVCGTTPGAAGSAHFGSMSGDGRVAFFTALKCGSGSGVNAGVKVAANKLLARVAGDETVLLSGRSETECQSVGCQSSPASAAEFQGASEDGSRAFFTSTQRLTDSGSEDEAASAEVTCRNVGGPNGCNLYMYDFGLPAGRRLVDVSAGDVSGVGPRVQGVMAVSPDGSHVYFVARGVLATEPNSQGAHAEKEANNLYVYERDGVYPEGHVAFIASLPQSDEGEWNTGTGYETARSNVTPDGGVLVFESHGALTLDDTRGVGPAQIYRYVAASNALSRVSVGQRGFNDNGNAGVAGARLAEPREYLGNPSVADDGEYVFFESPVGLTAGALNDVPIGADVFNSQTDYAENVYEWHAGQVFLISDGRDTGAFGTGIANSDVRLIGADASGANVFFTTADSLIPADTDTQVDIYDARVGGGFPAAAQSRECGGVECRAAGSLAPSLGPPLSGLFEGAGNPPVAPATGGKPRRVKRCVKGKRLAHGRCVKAKRKPKRGRRRRGGARRGARRGALASGAAGGGAGRGGRGVSGEARR
jgi:hypothetical protein